MLQWACVSGADGASAISSKRDLGAAATENGEWDHGGEAIASPPIPANMSDWSASSDVCAGAGDGNETSTDCGSSTAAMLSDDTHAFQACRSAGAGQ
eukprot:ctg_1499.g403